jgi:hypothetical protein
VIGDEKLGFRSTSQRSSAAFFAGKKHQVFFPAATEENIARVNLLRKPSDSTILMAIDAIDAIFLDQVNP